MTEQHEPVEEHELHQLTEQREQHSASAEQYSAGAEQQPQAGTPPRRRGNRRAGSAGATGLVPVKAKEDDPRVWGDSPEDRDFWLLEQRPPHWG